MIVGLCCRGLSCFGNFPVNPEVFWVRSYYIENKSVFTPSLLQSQGSCLLADVLW